MFYNIGQDADLVTAIHTWVLAIFNSMEGLKNISSINLDGSVFRSVEYPKVSLTVEISIWKFLIAEVTLEIAGHGQ